MDFNKPQQGNQQEVMAFNLQVTQKMMDSCLKALRPGTRRFGSAVDPQIRACFARFHESIRQVALA